VSDLSERHHKLVATLWVHEGIFGAAVNLLISGGSLFLLLWFTSFGDAAVSDLPGRWLVFAVPVVLIGFAAGALSTLYRFGRPMTIFAALSGSLMGFLAGILLLGFLQTSGSTDYEGYPVIRYAAWVASAMIVVGAVTALAAILLAWLIRKVSSGGK